MEKESFKELFVPVTKSIQSADLLGNNFDLQSLNEQILPNSPIINLNLIQNYNFSPISFLIKEGSRPQSPDPPFFSPAVDKLAEQNFVVEGK